MQKFIMEVSKKENGQYVKQGEVEIFYPLLSELGIAIDPVKNDDEGFPVYADDKVQYVFDGVLAAVKAQARNRLISGTATLKAGLSIASTVEELLESGGNKGDALAAGREFLAAFKAWLPTLGKSEKVMAAIYDMARNVATASNASQERKEKFAGYLTQFAETLNAEQAARFERSLTKLSEACEASEEW